MLKFLAALFLAVVVSTVGYAQQPAENYAVTLSAADWNVVLGALGERPAKDVFATIVKVQQQIGEAQQKTKLPAVPMPPPKPQQE